jgi:hypothetical protein
MLGSTGDGTSTVVTGSVGVLNVAPDSGLLGGGDMSVDQSIEMHPDQMRRQVGSHQQGVVMYNGIGTYPMEGSFYGGSDIPITTDGAYRLNYDGPMAASEFYATQYFYHSDARMKHDVESLDGVSALNMIGRLNPVTYSWNHDGREAIGLIAQDVEQTHPFLVATDASGMKSVDYTQMIAPLIAAVQELEARNNDLRARIEVLETR